jgi:hypothetical protein
MTTKLGRIRRYPGRDESVEIIGDRQNLANLLKDPAHSRSELINAIMSCYSGSAYGNSNWPKVTGGWTTPEVPTIYGKFLQQNQQLEQLSLDPGFITHLPEFMEYSNTKEQDYLKTRNNLKQQLGESIVWRGMILSKKEFQKTICHGIESDFLRKTEEILSPIDELEANVLSVYFNRLTEAHFHGENPQSPLISVSSHEDIATAVGRHFGKKSPEKELYLFKIKVPEIDLIYHTDHCATAPSKLKDLMEKGIQLRVSIDNREATYPWNRETESYILFKIDPGEILEISKPLPIQSSWNGRVCI